LRIDTFGGMNKVREDQRRPRFRNGASAKSPISALYFNTRCKGASWRVIPLIYILYKDIKNMMENDNICFKY
jgi:hypothetical protein